MSPPDGPFSEELDCLFTSVEQASDPEDDPLFDSMAEPGVCGLRNLGNTCFMSAGVQCLVATPPLVKVLMDKSASSTAPPHHELKSRLVDLAKQMWAGRFSSLQPLEFRNALVTLYPQFNDYRQHDCQEFLALLLDGLHEQMNTAVSKDFACQVEPREFKDPDHKEASTSNSQRCNSSGIKPNEVQSSVLCEPLVKRLHKGASNVVSNSATNTRRRNSNAGGNSNPESVTNENQQSMNNTPGRSFGSLKFAVPTRPRADKTLEVFESVADPPGSSRCQGDGPPPMDINGLCLLNNAVSRISGLEIFLKEAKTPNVNVLATEGEANNELRFDSEKYPRIDNIRCKENFNFNYFHDDDDNNVKCSSSSVNQKRCKKATAHNSPTSELKDGLDLKRVKLYCSDDEDPIIQQSDWKGEKNKRMELERKSKADFDSNLLEKNCRMEYERKKQQQLMETESEVDAFKEMMGVGTSGLGSFLGESSSSENQTGEIEAEKHWQQHLAANRSVIVDTFQGQFKSTVVCSICKFVSVTYEPFMYLSVPLPNALKKQICVTYVGKGGTKIVELTVEVKRHDSIGKVKEQVMTIVGDVKGNIVMGEVLNHHIAKILDDSHLVRDLNGINRSLYAFEVIICEDTASESVEDKKDNETRAEVETSCTICLEDKEVNMRRHVGCTCVLCDICVTASCLHQGSDFLECPVCRKVVNPEIDLMPLDPPSKVAVRMIYVPLVFRVDEVGDGNNNQKTVGLFGHPILLRLPNRFPADSLQSALSSLVTYQQPYKVLLVDGQGTHCSRCMYHAHCPGCQVQREGNVNLYSSDTLAITFSSQIQEIVKPVAHSTSLQSRKAQQPLSLYDCIRAFSQSEQLDEQNPWFCPHCRRNQCATKTLSIWRYPDYLIVYLKRFIFYDRVSTKLEDKVMFPLEGLNLASSIPLYDLYACVCHIGGISAGHYTSYTQHPNTKEWHYFNDSFVSKQSPQDEDYSSAYILFYKKRGLLAQGLEIEPETGSFSDII